jgi:FkbM family methyltransferase
MSPLRSIARLVAPTAVRDLVHALGDRGARAAFSERRSFVRYVYLRYERLRRQRKNRSVGIEPRRRPPNSTLPLKLADLEGHTLFVRPGTSDVDVIRESFVKHWTLPPQDLRDAKVIVDLGANIGATMAFAATAFPNAKVVGVEADPDTATLCRRNLARWGERCRVVCAAVWIRDGQVAFRTEIGEEWASAVVADEDGLTSRVRAISIDALFASEGLATVDYMKVDVEGAEEQLFSTATAWSQRVAVVKVEVHGGYTADRCADDLRKLGFEITACEPPMLVGIKPTRYAPGPISEP